MKSRRGQAIVLLLAVIFAMVALTLWVTDIRTFVMMRLHAQDGGDAAALAAARWQAAGLNLCGELNLIQAYMLADDKENLGAAHALHELRQRVQLTVPFLALLAAQELAEQNSCSSVSPVGNDYLRELGDCVYLDGYYDGAEEDLRAMLSMVSGVEPLYVVPLSSVYETDDAVNYLVEQDFYEAILARDWCWFWFYAYPFMQSYRQRYDFGQLPNLNTELFFGLRLTSMKCSYEDLVQSREAQMNTVLETLGHPRLPGQPSEDPAHEERVAEHIGDGCDDRDWIAWTIYDRERWGEWEAMTSGKLPLEGTLREEYNYEGASVALSVYRQNMTWMAAAKAFGKIAQEFNSENDILVLGAFEAVRLIPLDAADAGLRGFDINWVRHLRQHVPEYLFGGKRVDGCRYCSALQLWEDPEFRRSGLEWLNHYGHTCRRPTPGRGPGGGVHYAH